MTIQDDNERHCDTTFTQWRKSSYSNPNGNECVEVSFSNAVGMRDSHDPHGAVLVLDHGEWTVFLNGITAGEFRPIQPPTNPPQPTTWAARGGGQG